MMPTEDLICTGCGFLAKIKVDDGWGGRLHRKKSKGGLWNETQHSKIVLDWQGRNLEIIDDFAKNPWCLGLWTRQEKIHIIPALAVYVHLASRTGFHRRRSDQKSQPKVGSWDQWTKNPIFRWNIRKKESCQSINLVRINAQTHCQRINSETGDCMRAKQVRTDMRQ